MNLVSTKAHLAVIGDDDQSIYGFKQAHPEGIRNFREDRSDTEDVQFVVCRRCPPVVVTMAQTLIARNPGRVRDALQPHPGNPEGELHHVQWASVAEEAKGVAAFIRAKIAGGVDPGDCLVLTPRRKVGTRSVTRSWRRAIRARRTFRKRRSPKRMRWRRCAS